MSLTKHKDKILSHQELELWSGPLPLDIPSETAQLYIRWKGAPVPRGLLEQLVAFFRYAFLTWHSEVQVRLAYSVERRAWRAVALPQYISEGLSSKEVAGRDLTAALMTVRETALAELGDYVQNGTAHSHCDIGAFDSGGDKVDELGQPGFHLTIGHVSNGEVELHGRAVFRGVRYDIFWEDWFGEEPLATPEEAKRGLMRLAVPPQADVEALKQMFPANWLDACVERPKPAPVAPYDYMRGAFGYGFGSANNTPWLPDRFATPVDTPAHLAAEEYLNETAADFFGIDYEKDMLKYAMEQMEDNVGSPTLWRIVKEQVKLTLDEAIEDQPEKAADFIQESTEYVEEVAVEAENVVDYLTKLMDLLPVTNAELLKILTEAGALAEDKKKLVTTPDDEFDAVWAID